MDDDELVKEFLVESHENLDQLDQDLVTLESNPTDPELLSRIFRTIHTIKGTCGFLGFTKLEWVTHTGENLLSRMHNGELPLNAEITTTLLSLVDAVRQILECIETNGREGDADYSPLIETLTRIQEESVRPSDGQHAAAASTTTESPDQPAEQPSTETVADIPGPLDPEIPQPASTGLDEDLDGGLQSHAAGHIDRRIEQFLMESYEQADQLDQDLVTLEADPGNPELITRILGTLHTLKSSSGFMRFTATESATHAGEGLLIGLRDGTCTLTPENTTALLSLVDTVRQALVAIETTGSEQEVDYAPLIATLSRSSGVPDPGAVPPPAATPEEPKQTAEHLNDLRPAIRPASPPPQSVPGVPQSRDASQPDSMPARAEDVRESSDTPASATARSPSVADTSIRVDVGLLDRLMDQIGELVLARNQIMQFATHEDDRGVIAAYQRFDLITSELQEGVMKTRMQPIGTIWNKFPRVVRDLARDCGKQVRLSMEGEDTELDRTLIEAIRDPLTHLVRNAVDHGIETPDARSKAGKPETGNLFLRAFHEGGQVNISIADDGGGIDPQRIVRQAMERYLITAEQAAQMSDREILDLIFAPGFSTAETITNVSGRGVGMDVVKTNIDKINGTIDVQSQVGMGSTIRVKIPLTLAIIPALVIRCAGDRYAIPQANLIELVRLEGHDAHAKIENIRGAPVYRLRGKLLPLVYLENEIAAGADASTTVDPREAPIINIVVLQADERQFGLVVENVLDTEEIVVKPLGQEVKEIAVFAGATIMGDGNVALILDILGLAQRARVLSERRDALQTESSSRDEEQTASFQTLLFFESAGERMGLPLSCVTRLERFPWASIEKSGDGEVVQYWGQVMPLIDLARCLSSKPDSSARAASDGDRPDTREVVVLTVQSRSIGLVVDRILDTVEGALNIQPLRSRAGVMGTVVVQGRVTQLLDFDEIIQMAEPRLASQPADTAMGN